MGRKEKPNEKMMTSRPKSLNRRIEITTAASRLPQNSRGTTAETHSKQTRGAIAEEKSETEPPQRLPERLEGTRCALPVITTEDLSLPASLLCRRLKTRVTKVAEVLFGRTLLPKNLPTMMEVSYKLSFVRGAIAGVIVGLAASFWLIRFVNVDRYAAGLTALDKATSTEPPRPELRSLESELSRIAQEWIDRTPEIAKKFQQRGLPVDMNSKVHNRPRPEGRPFFFFHQRKAGGTTVRSHLYEASIEYNITRWIPCHEPRTCRHYNIPMQNKPKRSHPDHGIYAAHMYYADVANQLEFAPRRNDRYAKGMYYAFEPTKTFDCVTNFRNPIDRVVSSWNFRQVVHGARRSNELSAEAWDWLLPVAFSNYGKGNNNEAARVFGNIADERVVNALTAAGNNATQSQAIVVANELEAVLSRVSNCVVMLLVDRCEDSKTIVGHFFPWFDDFMNCTTRLQVGKHRASDGLQPGAEDVIRKHNLIDVHAYNFATTLFEELLLIATRHGK